MAFPSTRRNAQVVHGEEPILTEPSPKDSEDQLLEVFRPICRSKSQSSRQPTASRREHSHLLLCVFLIVHLIEPFLEVAYGDELIASHGTLDVV